MTLILILSIIALALVIYKLRSPTPRCGCGSTQIAAAWHGEPLCSHCAITRNRATKARS
jgi:hypothetical protein